MPIDGEGLGDFSLFRAWVRRGLRGPDLFGCGTPKTVPLREMSETVRVFLCERFVRGAAQRFLAVDAIGSGETTEKYGEPLLLR